MPSLVVESPIRILLLDIEGTTTPIEFVYQTLFPYVIDKIEYFLHEHFLESEISLLVSQLHNQHHVDEHQGQQPPVWTDETGEVQLRSCVAYIKWLMGKDNKSTPLKSLQGKIWQEGYGRGELRGQVYADVPRAFARWRMQKREICIYSSGSVLAQQLLFQTIPSGDLTPQIAGYFDTMVGAKTDARSYRRIAESLSREPYDFLFISDTAKEVEAGNGAGMQSFLCNRNLTSPLPQKGKPSITSFDEVFPD